MSHVSDMLLFSTITSSCLWDQGELESSLIVKLYTGYCCAMTASVSSFLLCEAQWGCITSHWMWPKVLHMERLSHGKTSSVALIICSRLFMNINIPKAIVTQRWFLLLSSPDACRVEATLVPFSFVYLGVCRIHTLSFPIQIPFHNDRFILKNHSQHIFPSLLYSLRHGCIHLLEKHRLQMGVILDLQEEKDEWNNTVFLHSPLCFPSLSWLISCTFLSTLSTSIIPPPGALEWLSSKHSSLYHINHIQNAQESSV